MAFSISTYSDKTNREDLLKLIADISPDKTPLSEIIMKRTKKPENELWKKLQTLL